VDPGTFYPIIRARLTEINGKKATDIIHESDSGGRTVNRELNLTWLKDRPDGNQLMAGTWPPQSG